VGEDAGVAILVDPPKWPAHGRLWGHLVSDTSLEELHAFARRLGIPPRGFDADHYDLPEEHLDTAIAAGAELVTSAELVRRLTQAGLRVRRPAPSR
jgi:hypothetical protein